MYNSYLFIQKIGECIKNGNSEFIKKCLNQSSNYSIFNTFINNLKNNEKQIYYSSLFHYFYSHGNIHKVRDILELMNKDDISYHRHYLKFLVLEWWYNFYIPYIIFKNNHSEIINELDNNESNKELINEYKNKLELMNISYKNIMNKIYEILDKHRCLEKTPKNAFQMIRDHIFYYKMGLFENSIEIMNAKCRKWFLRCNLDKIYMKELNKRIQYINQDYMKYNKVYLGIHWDDIDYNEQTSINNIFIIPKKIN